MQKARVQLSYVLTANKYLLFRLSEGLLLDLSLQFCLLSINFTLSELLLLKLAEAFLFFSLTDLVCLLNFERLGLWTRGC